MPALAIAVPPLVGIGPMGPFELIIVLAVVIIIFGVGKLPEVGGAIGKGIKEFRKASKEDDEPKKIAEAPSTMQPPPAVPPVAASAAPSVSVTCQKCGTANPPSNSFCASCGASLEARSATCQKCGTVNAPGNKFCSSCGASLEATVG
jgi:sec-independent protein translocase protein TatA